MCQTLENLEKLKNIYLSLYGSYFASFYFKTSFSIM